MQKSQQQITGENYQQFTSQELQPEHPPLNLNYDYKLSNFPYPKNNKQEEIDPISQIVNSYQGSSSSDFKFTNSRICENYKYGQKNSQLVQNLSSCKTENNSINNATTEVSERSSYTTQQMKTDPFPATHPPSDPQPNCFIQKQEQQGQKTENQAPKPKNSFSMFTIHKISQLIKENIKNPGETEYQDIDRNLLKYSNLETQENTFFKSLVIIHFKHLLYNDHIDIHNLSLFDLFERVKNKKIVLKPSPLYHSNTTSQQLSDSFCSNIYTLIKLKTQVGRVQLFKNFLEMIVNEKTFFESLQLIMKQLAIENVNSDNLENNEEFRGIIQHIHHSWIEMKPEFITLLSRTLNKQIEVTYLLEGRAESMMYERVKTRYNAENTRIRLIYWHSNEFKKSFYFPLIDEDEITLFVKDTQNTMQLPDQVKQQEISQHDPSLQSMALSHLNVMQSIQSTTVIQHGDKKMIHRNSLQPRIQQFGQQVENKKEKFDTISPLTHLSCEKPCQAKETQPPQAITPQQEKEEQTHKLMDSQDKFQLHYQDPNQFSQRKHQPNKFDMGTLFSIINLYYSYYNLTFPHLNKDSNENYIYKSPIQDQHILQNTPYIQEEINSISLKQEIQEFQQDDSYQININSYQSSQNKPQPKINIREIFLKIFQINDSKLNSQIQQKKKKRKNKNLNVTQIISFSTSQWMTKTLFQVSETR